MRVMTGLGDGAPELILASASPRRRDLLRAIGLDPRVEPAEVDETPDPGEDPSELVLRLAVAKARAVAGAPAGAGQPSGDRIVIGADTVIDCDGEVLGKPVDRADARRMLEQLSGRSHVVATGVAVVGWCRGRSVEASAIDRSRVTFRALSAAEIEWYLDSGEPMGKAGAYAIQGLGSLLVERLEGSYHGVVGLPLVVLDRLLGEVGVSLRDLADADRLRGVAT